MVSFNPMRLIDIFANWLSVLNRLWVYFNTPIAELNVPGLNPIANSIRSFLVELALGDLTTLELMLGVGLTFYLVWQLVTWFLNFIT